MECMRCLNTDPKYFYQFRDRWICRRCIHLDGLEVDPSINVDFVDSQSHLKFELTPIQKQVSQGLLEYGFNQNILIHAVCGAGKTEMMIEFVQKGLENGLKIGWMIARRQVVLQLRDRLSKVYPKMKVLAVCQGYTADLVGDLILCTAHQLYRYPKYFDVLIIDEPDAYPFANDPLLEGLAKVSCKGNFIYLTATPSTQILKQVQQTLTVHRRPHNRDLVLPKVITAPNSILFLILVKMLFQSNHSWLVFMPSIVLANRIGKLLKLPVLTSQSNDSQERIERFINKEDRILLCTTVLERGVTFEEISVIVYQAHSPLFDEASLIQISGRVGRSFTSDKGECYFLCSQKSKAVSDTLQTIQIHNRSVESVFKT